LLSPFSSSSSVIILDFFLNDCKFKVNCPAGGCTFFLPAVFVILLDLFSLFPEDLISDELLSPKIKLSISSSSSSVVTGFLFLFSSCKLAFADNLGIPSSKIITLKL
jgi:hypothetical protein